ncbi:lysylphosphatidylglycerol synthase transmembrane domain-containing protein [Symmachiella dynata]|uniref:lysylphosphatidylglycerol synthase transmembrane domain-containing protein n=1 Tax=Symmachiella dynata TaxID=2527995 RepID=UPI0030EE3DD7
MQETIEQIQPQHRMCACWGLLTTFHDAEETRPLDKLFAIAGKLKWPFAIGMLAYLLFQHWDNFKSLLHGQKNWGFFALGFTLVAGCAALTFVRWYLLVWAQEFDFTLKDAFRLGGFGLLCNYGGPGIVGGDLLKAAMVARNQQSRRAVAAATVVLDRILGLLALFMVGALATLFVDFDTAALNEAAATAAAADKSQEQGFLASVPMMSVVGWSLWGGSIAGVVGLLVMLTPGSTRWPILQKLVGLKYVGKTLGDLLNGIALYQTKRRVVALAVVISLIGHAGLVAGFYCCARSLNVWVPNLWAHYYFMPAAELFASVIPVPGGVGPLEGAISFFYGLTAAGHVTKETAEATGVAAALVFRVTSVVTAVMGAGYYMLTKPKSEPDLLSSKALDPPQEPTAATKLPV